MASIPIFPKFKKFEIGDKDVIQDFFRKYQPDVSELTFTNLFIWRQNYRIKWSVYKDWLFLLCNTISSLYAMEPVGPKDRTEPLLMLFKHLKDLGEKHPSVQRADKRIVDEIQNSSLFSIEPSREYFDYVYLSEDLIKLPGRKYHSKRNHISGFESRYAFSYERFKEAYTDECMVLADHWCKKNRCADDLDLLEERCAINDILLNFNSLDISGGVIIIDKKVQGFAFGEMLNSNTGVVHIEKVNPDITGLYQVINQKFAEDVFKDVKFINREEDLGIEGLRKAKTSYYPYSFAEKFKITPR